MKCNLLLTLAEAGSTVIPHMCPRRSVPPGILQVSLLSSFLVPLRSTCPVLLPKEETLNEAGPKGGVESFFLEWQVRVPTEICLQRPMQVMERISLVSMMLERGHHCLRDGYSYKTACQNDVCGWLWPPPAAQAKGNVMELLLRAKAYGSYSELQTALEPNDRLHR